MLTFRVMTYNVQSGGRGREGLIRDVIESIGPDLAVFTEVTAEESFATMAGAVGEHRILAPYRVGRTRVAIACRWPILEGSCHGPAWSSRKWLEATVRPHGGAVVTVHAIHLAAQPLWPFELWRRGEVQYLVRRLHRRSGTPQIAAGDFNALMPGDSQRLQGAPVWVRVQWFLQGEASPRVALRALTDAGYIDCYRACHAREGGFTVPAKDPGARIDYVFASRELRSWLRASDTSAGRSRNRLASDHLPLWADFEWPLLNGAGSRPSRQANQ